jgi:poly(3-hydroxybutyrate) depolymerase
VARETMPLDAPATARLTAFADDLATWPDEATYEAEQAGQEPPLGAKSLIPTGLFTDADQEAVAHMLLTGRVLAAEVKQNGSTGETFRWALARTFGGTTSSLRRWKSRRSRPRRSCKGTSGLSARSTLRRLGLLLAGLALVAQAGCFGNGASHFTVRSELLGRSLEQAVLVPEGKTKGRPVLVLLHGRSSSPDSMVKGSFRDALERLGKRAPIIVFANGGDHSYYHDRSDGRWGSYILREVIPTAVRRYHADGSRVAIGGFSMGGFGAFDLARFSRFCAVGGHSAAMWRTGAETPEGAFDDAEDFARHDVMEAAAANPRLYGKARVWIDVGTDDPFRSADEELARRLPGARLHVWEGGHDFSYFEDHSAQILGFYADALARC